MRARLRTPSDFSLRSTVNSHGWPALAPFTAASDGSRVATFVEMPSGEARHIVLTGERQAVLESPGPATPAERRALVAAGRRVLALDVDVSGLHDAVRGHPRHDWIARTRSGRFLRAPTAFEDLVKLVLTTNCSWAFTKKATAIVVGRYGAPAKDGARAFPSPARLAAVKERELRNVVRAGYRAPYLAKLSRAVAEGSVDPGVWDDDPRDAEVLRKDILALPGVGPYVAENVLKFLGKPHGLALDSAIRARYAEIYHGGRMVRDRSIARRMARLGRWAGIALWFDLWRDWSGEVL